METLEKHKEGSRWDMKRKMMDKKFQRIQREEIGIKIQEVEGCIIFLTSIGEGSARKETRDAYHKQLWEAKLPLATSKTSHDLTCLFDKQPWSVSSCSRKGFRLGQRQIVQSIDPNQKYINILFSGVQRVCQCLVSSLQQLRAPFRPSTLRTWFEVLFIALFASSPVSLRFSCNR